MTLTLSGLPVAMAANGFHMVTTKSLFWVCATLIALDAILTMFGVSILGATELNPLATILGFNAFMLMKMVLSGVAMYVMYKCCLSVAPTATRCGMSVLFVFYGLVCASNVYHIAAAIL